MTGEELREFRKALNFTQIELAEKLGVAGNTIARWERNEKPIPPYLALALRQIELNQSGVIHQPLNDLTNPPMPTINLPVEIEPKSKSIARLSSNSKPPPKGE